MTKKHYEAIARVMKEMYDHEPLNGSYWSQAKTTSKALADYFAQDNPKFDRTRFLQACGIES